MHPRCTRNRPLILLPNSLYNVFVNNIDSPGFMKWSYLTNDKSPIQADAMSCHYVVGHETEVNGLHLGCFHVEFRLEEKKDSGPVASVVVHVPAQWTADLFLAMFLKNLKDHTFISLINSYYLDGQPFAFNKINTIHYLFKGTIHHRQQRNDD
jgi:hypothetical protein